ncbi:LytTR family DNA-binding domain-containing protein [Paenibacillus larvae]|uniref:LytTR family DNA-binding domain-containing protein n=1 Tax=Paenibacillus larvae TaxID=1464 RepID=UPI00227DD033|nr:LytTR family DNA-binding domain-containing protein [Paenibacillus larvae]
MIQRYVVVKTNTEQIVLRASDIIAIEKVDKKHLELITMEQRFAAVSTLAEFSIKLDASFYQIYRSIIINLEHVHKFTATTVVMSNKDKFPLGRSKGKGIKEAYARYRIAQFNERG